MPGCGYERAEPSYLYRTLRGCLAPATGPLYIENNRIQDLKTGLYGNLCCLKVGNDGGGTTYLTENVCDVACRPACPRGLFSRCQPSGL